MSLYKFQTMLDLLKRYDRSSIEFTKESLGVQKNELMIEKGNRQDDLNRTVLQVKRVNENHQEKVNKLKSVDLPNLQNTLINQQRSNIYTDAKKMTIARIIQCNQEIERFQKSINENLLRVKTASKILMSIIKEIDKIDGEIKLMDECLTAITFIQSQGIADVDSISDYEVERLYRTYQKGGY